MRRISWLLILLVSALSYSCNRNMKDGKICGLLPDGERYKDKTLLVAEAINGDELPYYSVYIDEENYVEITRIQLSIYKDGSWDSQMWATELVDGDITLDVVERNGEYSCTGGGIALEESDGVDAGLLNENADSNVDADWVLMTGSNQYYFNP